MLNQFKIFCIILLSLLLLTKITFANDTLINNNNIKRNFSTNLKVSIGLYYNFINSKETKIIYGEETIIGIDSKGLIGLGICLEKLICSYNKTMTAKSFITFMGNISTHFETKPYHCLRLGYKTYIKNIFIIHPSIEYSTYINKGNKFTIQFEIGVILFNKLSFLSGVNLFPYVNSISSSSNIFGNEHNISSRIWSLGAMYQF